MWVCTTNGSAKILHVNLTNKRTWKQDLDTQFSAKFLGGRGINSRLLWDAVKPGVDCFHPDNVLIFGPGALTGTTAPSSGRTTVTCKGATNHFLKTSMGGHWGAELKFAGYDHLVIHGRSETPVYLCINDNEVEVKDASHLWGMDVRSTDETLKKDIGDNDAIVACIGPAGENLVRFAAIMNSVYNAAGRGGAGAVMGSKKLKAICVRGTGEISVKNPERFQKIVEEIAEAQAKDVSTASTCDYGTSGAVEWLNELHVFPAYNFQSGHIEHAEFLSGQYLVKAGYLTRRAACFSCRIGCHRFTFVREEPYAGTRTGGPEYETMSALGAGTGVTDTNAVIKANDECNIMGLDTISTGGVIQWAMECYEKGVLTAPDTDGLEMKFGNADAMVKLISLIAHREGRMGMLLADGVKRAADAVGKDSYKWAICNSKGLEQSRVETRSAKGYALSFAVNPRGPDHLHTQVSAEFGGGAAAVALIERITGKEGLATPYTTESRAEIVRWHEDCYAIADSLGFCSFTTEACYVNPGNMAEIYSAATGLSFTESDIMLAGRRIVTLEKCFNTREGADRELDDLPWRLMHEPAPSGPLKGSMNTQEELDGMLDKYYALHGWNLETSWPYAETLEMLGLEDVSAELRKLGKLPRRLQNPNQSTTAGNKVTRNGSVRLNH